MIVGCVGYPPATILDYVYSCLLALVVLLPLCFIFLSGEIRQSNPPPKALKENSRETQLKNELLLTQQAQKKGSLTIKLP